MRPHKEKPGGLGARRCLPAKSRLPLLPRPRARAGKAWSTVTGLLHIAILPTRRLYVLDPKTWQVQAMWQLAGNRAHGVGWEDDTLWVADTNWRAFFRHDRKTGEIVEKIQLTENDPLIHGWKCPNLR